MHILEQITDHKLREVARQKRAVPQTELEASEFFRRSCISLCDAVLARTSNGIIAEHKIQSPSAGRFPGAGSLQRIVQSYAAAGVSGISILTDKEFFGGSLGDLQLARGLVSVPLLRKDFVVDAYQLYEAKASGADVVLLICECLDAMQIREFTDLAHALGMEVLLELHSVTQLDKIPENVDLLGINNRDLTTFHVSLDTIETFPDEILTNYTLVAESGIHTPVEYHALRQRGFRGFLIGGAFMSQKDPGNACRHFVHGINVKQL